MSILDQLGIKPETALIVSGSLFLGLGLVWILLRRPWRGPRTRYPVVLAHGVLGFDEIGVGKYKQKYFRGIFERLESNGLKVYCFQVPPLSSVAKRAEVLAEKLRSIPERRVNIIAHSMGGLDARYAISRLNCLEKVASLITIGTPHQGMCLADLGSSLLGDKLGLRRLLKAVGWEMNVLDDMTTNRMANFNREIKNAYGVYYGCVLATVQSGQKTMNPLLVLPHKYLQRKEGPSDGLVSKRSQRWGRVLAKIHADHWAQIGWSSRFQAPEFYIKLMKKIRSRGL